MSSFFGELKRRNVFRVAAIYVVVGWLLLQVGDILFENLLLPDWSTRMLTAFLILGFPLAMIFAWAYEITPDGVLKTEDVPPEHSITSETGQKINYLIIAGLAIAVAILLFREFSDSEAPESNIVVASAVPLEDSIAVLPFKNQSASAEVNAEFFAGGVHDELLTLLSRIGDMKVISRTSVERLDRNLSIPEIGELLEVATVLEGQVQRAGNRLRINVQLINAVTEGHIWANTYDRELTAENVFDVQSDIARTISGALHAELKPSGETLLAAIPTTNTEALENYLLGVQTAKRFSYEALAEAEQYFLKAVELDPDYDEAWTELAYVYSQSAQTGQISRAEYVELAEPVIRKALTLNPRSAEALAAQGFLQSGLFQDEASEESFLQALKIDPNSSRTRELYGFVLRSTFRAPEAIPILEAALAIDPLSTEILFQLGKAEMHSGMPEKLLERAARMREIDPTVINGHAGSMQAHIWQNQLDQAMPYMIKSLEVDEDDYETFAHNAVHMEVLLQPEAADRILARAEEKGPSEPAVLKCRVIIHLLRGEFDDALQISRQALEADLDDRWGSDIVFLETVTRQAVIDESPESALDYYRIKAPRLFDPDPRVEIWDMFLVPGLSVLLRMSGDDELADDLLGQAYTAYEAVNPNHIHGYDFNVLDVEILTMLGRHDEALRYLTKAVDENWGVNWGTLEHNPVFDGIRDRDEFNQVLSRLYERKAEQAANFAAMPDLGKYDFRTKKGSDPRPGSDPI